MRSASSASSAAGFGSMSHLLRRFVGSLWPGGPSRSEDTWVRSYLNDGEAALWVQMSGPDRRHAVAVGRRVAGDHRAAGHQSAIRAALLHDVGKVESGLGPWRRAAATAVAMAIGRPRLAQGRGRMARYVRHDTLGAHLLERAGSDGFTVAWAREHHLPTARWTVPHPLGEALKAADDD